MRRIRYSVLRWGTLLAYLLTTVFLCVHIARMGMRELDKAQAYTKREKEYARKLLECDRRTGAAEGALERYLFAANPRSARNMLYSIELARASADKLAAAEDDRTFNSVKSAEELKDHSTRLLSIANAILNDGGEPPWERRILVGDGLRAALVEIGRLRSDINVRLDMELRHVENWRDQSLYFYERLESQLVYFFVIATCLVMAAFALSGYVLRRYLGMLRVGAHKIATGHLGYRFNDETGDLVGTVMRDFDTMGEQLQKQHEALQSINEELVRKADELEEAHRHKDRFLANMSHELRTPLNSIIGFSELILRKRDGVSEKTAGFASRILAAAEHLLELISDLLDVAKADAGALDMNPVDFDLAAEAAAVVAMLRPLADAKSIDLELDKPGGPVKVHADRRLIRQAIINLANNALKFTKKGGVTISVAEDDGSAVVAISDTGIGIAKDEIGKIFKDFHRVEQGLTSNYDGVGLGLTLTKRIVELHGGAISVESEPGKGSVFTMKFPLRSGESVNP